MTCLGTMRAAKTAALAFGVAVGALIMAGSGPAMAAVAPPAKPDDPTTVSELIVTAEKMVSELTVTATIKCLPPARGQERAERPKIVSAFPQRGAVVRPGLLVIRMTFDQPMACDGGLGGDPPLPAPCPQATQQMLLSYDRRTVRTVCIVEPNLHYGAQFNRDLTGRIFMGLSGLPAHAHAFDFTTSSEPAITTVCDALIEDTETAVEIQKRHKLDCASPPAPAGG